ncbi:sensor histidine kinase [Noviherbaspirillum galbum]|uniref:histidine kinase n=1 Tax=Noviherbaspirillum galbum TaxID=2709383 RepID=A0A6B3STI4_9BURK|nr:histidine kinase [Noviherbaspirillum galbum]NEX61712.1 sensor histidine kinase [Noviherbaspirillum galbum]
MPSNLPETLRKNARIAIHNLRIAFDKTAAWVAQLSWKKFILFCILVLIGGALVDEMFSRSSHPPVMVQHSGKKNKGPTVFEDDDTDIRIDGSGIRIRKKGASSKPEEDQDPKEAAAPAPATPADASPPSASPVPSPPSPPSPPEPPQPPKPPKVPRNIRIDNQGINIDLPPDVSEEVKDAIDQAVEEAAAEKAEKYRKKSSAWFMNFVLLLLVGLFGMKALMGGKKRAEARASAATADAEREALQRQVVEAKMQMMQAQVEPHFLFNTLASVEHLIETDPPRAAAMQRTLIQYLRAVLPQMRETPTTTNLGRETDIVRSYLDLLKMRMEERLTVDINVPTYLRAASFPPMMLQSMVENAIKHGLESKPEGGTLRLMAEVSGNKLMVTVADNGLGFGAVKSNGTGLGLQNIRERLKLLYGEHAQLIIVPNSPTGVCATIELPYQPAS